jgi:hypothetical protein
VQYQSNWVFGHLSDIQPPKQPKGVTNPLLEQCRCDSRNRHDPFDARQSDRFAFEVFPLIYSAGPDKKYDIYHGVTDRDTVVDAGPAVDANDPYAKQLTLKTAANNASKLDSLDDPFVEIRTDAVPCSAYNPFGNFNQDSPSVFRPKSPGTPKDLFNESRFSNGKWLWDVDTKNGVLSHFDNIHNHTLDNRLR